MSLSKIEFIKGSGGLGRTNASEDGITGLLFYGDKPAEFGADSIKQVFSIVEAESFGIDETETPVLHYHVSEFFRIHKNGSLYVGVYDAPDAEEDHDFAEVTEIQNFADGRLRQLGIYTQVDFEASQVATLQAKLAALENENKPLSSILVANIDTAFTLSTLPDLRAANAPKVSVLIGQDAGATGDALYTSEGKTIGALGALLGTVAKSSVNESIAWVGKFSVSETELDVIGFGEGTTFRGVTSAQLNEIDNKGYIFLQKHVGISGSYFNGSHTAIAEASDYSTIEKNRAIDKAIRMTRTSLLPLLSSPIYVNPVTGKLSEDTIQAFQSEANRPVERMAINGELSGAKAFINPDQNVLANDRLDIMLELVPVGVARVVRVKIGFVTQLSSN